MVNAVAVVSPVIFNIGIALGKGLSWCAFLTSAQENSRQAVIKQQVVARNIVKGLSQLMRWSGHQIYIKERKIFFATSEAAVKVIIKQECVSMELKKTGSAIIRIVEHLYLFEPHKKLKLCESLCSYDSMWFHCAEGACFN